VAVAAAQDLIILEAAAEPAAYYEDQILLIRVIHILLL